MLNFKERFEEIKSKRDILSHTIPQRISENEEEEAYKWWTSHKCFLDKNNWKADVELGTLYPNIKLIPNSIATAILVECPFCGENENVSDFSRW